MAGLRGRRLDYLGVYTQRFGPNGGRLGSETLVNTTTASDQYEPSIAVLANGTYVVAWSSFAQDGDDYGVHAQRFSATGAKLGGEVQVNTQVLESQRTPSVTALSGG